MYYITLETLNILKYWDFKLLSTQGLTGGWNRVSSWQRYLLENVEEWEARRKK